MQAFARDGRPNFECVVIGAGNDAIAAKLQTSDDVIVVCFKNFWISNWARAPIHFDDVLSHVRRFPWRRHWWHGADAATFRPISRRFYTYATLFALLFPQQIVVAQETPTATRLCCAQ